jgi:putative transposase
MSDILPLILSLQTVLPKTQCRQLAQIALAMLVMPCDITQRGISRWTDKGGSYRTIQRFFHTEIDWLQVKWLFFQLFAYIATDTYLLVGDETVLKKAGKQTFGLDRFFSSLADRPVPGVAFFALALVNVRTRQAYTLTAEQVVRSEAEKEQAKRRRQECKTKVADQTPKKSGRPQGSKNKNKAEVVLCPELERILAWTQKVMALVGKKIPVRYFVLDGHFGNHPAYQMTRQLNLHLICKMRHNAALYYLPTQEEQREHPRLKYGQRVRYDALALCYRVSGVEEDGYRNEVYQMPCRHKDFSEVQNVVILKKTHLKTGRSAHVILFSSDRDLAALTLVEYYRLRFQIEFEFRDAKQHFGLSDFRAVSEIAVKNSVGLAFFMGNLSAYLLGTLQQHFPQAGIADLKSYYRGRRYVLEVLKCLPEIAQAIVYSQVMQKVGRLGCIHPRPHQTTMNL